MNDFKKKMKELNLSKKEVALRLALPYRVFKIYLNDPGEMPCTEYARLCEVLNVPFDSRIPKTFKSVLRNQINNLGIRNEKRKLRKFKRALRPHEELYEITDDRMSGVGIEYGDLVVVDITKKPMKPLEDIILFTKYQLDGRHDSISLYWGKYVGHWAKEAPRSGYAYHAWVEEISGVVKAVYDVNIKQKWRKDLKSYPSNIQDGPNTIDKEPSNIGGMCGDNAVPLKIRKGETYTWKSN